MVKNSSALSKQQLNQVLGQVVSEQELAKCFQLIEIIEPTVGKRLWQTAETSAGIYIILAGKARLLDSSDNLIASLEVRAVFGQSSLFPKQQFQSYAARVQSVLSFAISLENVCNP